MDELSRGGDDAAYKLPRGKIDGSPYDMSFSGLKTAVVNIVHNAEQKGEVLDGPSLAASFAAAVSDTLVPRTMAAAAALGYNKIVVAGGVACKFADQGGFHESVCSAGQNALTFRPCRFAATTVR